MSMEAMTTDPMYTTELYKSVAVNETSVTGNEDSSEEFKNAAPEDGVQGDHYEYLVVCIMTRITSLPCAGNMRGVTEIIFLRMALKGQVARVVGRITSGKS